MVLFVYVFLYFCRYFKQCIDPERISIPIQEEVTRQTRGPELNKGQTLGLQLGRPLLNEVHINSCGTLTIQR